MSVIEIVIGCLLTSNIVLSNFLGICPFLGLSKKTSNSIGMGGALVFVVTMSAIICYCIQKFILVPLQIEYLQLVIFILVIASFVQFVEFFLKKYVKGLYKALGIYLPLITTNCIVLFVAQKVAGYALVSGEAVYNFSFGTMILYAIFTSLGYTMVITLFSFIRTRVDTLDTPKAFRGNAIALITTSLMVLAFNAFAGLT